MSYLSLLIDLHMRQANLFWFSSILITCFSFDLNGQTAYRFYFKDIDTGYLHNPMVEDENGKRKYPHYLDYVTGLEKTIVAAERYVNQKPT